MDSQDPGSPDDKLVSKVEICASCLRGQGFINGPQDREGRRAFLQRLIRDVGEDEKIEMKLGQCQRLCPENRVTLASRQRHSGSESAGASSHFGEEKLSCTEGEGYEQLVRSLRHFAE